jgi:hypothetical protein
MYTPAETAEKLFDRITAVATFDSIVVWPDSSFTAQTRVA